MDEWFILFTDTHSQNGMGGFIRAEWPEPGGYSEQPAVIPIVMKLIVEALHKSQEMEPSSGQ